VALLLTAACDCPKTQTTPKSALEVIKARTSIRAYLGIPEGITPLAIVPVGYPAERPEPKDKWKPENIHYDKW
jgi:nitroreductase